MMFRPLKKINDVFRYICFADFLIVSNKNDNRSGILKKISLPGCNTILEKQVDTYISEFSVYDNTLFLIDAKNNGLFFCVILLEKNWKPTILLRNKRTFFISFLTAGFDEVSIIAPNQIPPPSKCSMFELIGYSHLMKFSEWVKKVEYAVTEKNFSPVLTWVLIKSKKEEDWSKLIFVGTDSFRLAEYKIKNIIENDIALIVPKLSINDIQKITEYGISKECDTMKIFYSENLIAFEFAIKDMKIIATSLLIQGNFPEYDREEIIPRQFNTTILVDRTICEKAIKKIWILTKDINNFIQIECNKDSIVISSGKYCAVWNNVL